MKCDEIFAALAMLEKERGIPQDFMMNKIVQALTTAYKRDHEGVENVVVEVNEEKRDLKMFVQKEIVEEVENPGSQISLEEAQQKKKSCKVGDEYAIPLKTKDFGRIAAQTAKHVIRQGLKEAERSQMYAEMQGAMGVVVNVPTSGLVISRMRRTIDIPIVVTVANQGTDYARRIDDGAAIFNVAAGSATAEIVAEIRAQYPDMPIMATGGPSDESILRTIDAGANAITYTPPSSAELFKHTMERYRMGLPYE